MYITIIVLVYFFLFLVIGFRSKAFLYKHVCSPVFLNNNVILRKRYASDISCKGFFTSLHQKMFAVRLYQTFSGSRPLHTPWNILRVLQPTLWLYQFCLEDLSVHGNETRLFMGNAFFYSCYWCYAPDSSSNNF